MPRKSNKNNLSKGGSKDSSDSSEKIGNNFDNKGLIKPQNSETPRRRGRPSKNTSSDDVQTNKRGARKQKDVEKLYDHQDIVKNDSDERVHYSKEFKKELKRIEDERSPSTMTKLKGFFERAFPRKVLLVIILVLIIALVMKHK